MQEVPKFCGDCGFELPKNEIVLFCPKCQQPTSSPSQTGLTYVPDTFPMIVQTMPGRTPNTPVSTAATQILPVQPSTKKIPKLMVIALAVLIIFASGIGLWIHNNSARQPTVTSTSTVPGIGIQTVQDGGLDYQIGLTDGNNGTDPFAANEPDQSQALDFIFKANKEIQSSSRFTIIVAATLSRSNSDQNQSESIGVEQLRGAYIAQLNYNARSIVKMRIIVANLGTKLNTDKMAPVISGRILLYAKAAPPSDHFVGVEGYPFSRTAASGLPLLTKSCIPVVSSSASSTTLSQTDIGCFHRVIMPDDIQNPYEEAYIASMVPQPKTILLSEDLDDVYSKDFFKIMKQNLEGRYRVITATYKENAESIGAFLATVKAYQKQGVIFDLWDYTGYPTQLSQIRSSAKANSMVMPLAFGGGALYEEKGYEPGDFTNVIFSSSAYADGPDANEAAFQVQYRSIYDKLHTFPHQLSLTQAMLENDGLSAFQQAIARSQDLSASAVRQSLNSLSFSGLTGPVQFNADSTDPGQRPLYMLCAKDGVVHWLTRYTTPAESVNGEPMSVCY